MPNSNFCQKYYCSFTLRVPYRPMTAKKKFAFRRFAKQNKKY